MEAPLSSLAKRPNLSKNVSVDLCDLLTCSICNEIMFDCVSIQPCLHSYCRHCLLQWRAVDNICPLCRCNILGYGKNHQLGCIIEEYLKRHPESQKSAEEKEKIRCSLDSLQTELPRVNDTDATSPSNSYDGSSNESQDSTHVSPVSQTAFHLWYFHADTNAYIEEAQISKLAFSLIDHQTSTVLYVKMMHPTNSHYSNKNKHEHRGTGVHRSGYEKKLA
uniref:RING-type domain-containing protein n=3 Tax=Schistocephalus solidus TaxID=70667 RepID=A0A0V0J2L5_SCHSO